jgi:hypothetical protein
MRLIGTTSFKMKENFQMADKKKNREGRSRNITQK